MKNSLPRYNENTFKPAITNVVNRWINQGYNKDKVLQLLEERKEMTATKAEITQEKGEAVAAVFDEMKGMINRIYRERESV